MTPADPRTAPKPTASGATARREDDGYFGPDSVSWRAFADPAWPLRAPWMEAEQGFGTRLPNLLWPEGREWVLVSEIDFDSTLVACSRACADALLASPDLEAVEITRDTPLWS